MAGEELDKVFDNFDEDKDAIISQDEFNTLYINSKELIRSQIHLVFDKLDRNRSGTLEQKENRDLPAELDPGIIGEDVDDAVAATYQEGVTEEVTFQEFSDWYEKSILYKKQKKALEEGMERVLENLKAPRTWSKQMVFYFYSLNHRSFYGHHYYSKDRH